MAGVRVEMMALSIGPDFRYEPKKIYELSAELADAYVSAGFAFYVDQQQPMEGNDNEAEENTRKRAAKPRKR